MSGQPESSSPSRRSGRRKAFVTWSRWLAKLVVAAVALYACVFLLQLIGLVTHIRSFPGRPVHLPRLDPVEKLTAPTVTLSGEAPPGSMVEVGLGQRTIDSGYAKPSGRFRLEFRVPPWAGYVWVQAQDPGSGETHRTELSLEWGPDIYEPTLTVAFHITDLKQLWVAGQATPGERVTVENESGDVLQELAADHFGVLDTLIPISSEPPAQVLARPKDSNDPQPSAPIGVTEVPQYQLPLSRVVDIYLTDSESRLAIQITMPDDHPYFRALAQGYLSARSFVNMTLGEYFPSYHRGPRERATLVVRKGRGVVSFETGLDERLTDFRILSSGGVGISSVPLLSVNDRITLHKAGNLPVWFDDPLPVEITENEATWRGPLQGGGYGQVVAFGYGAPEGMEGRQGRADTIEQEEGRRKAETLQDFLSRFEQRVGGGIIKQTWRTLILLIPFIGLLWLARRCPFGTAETWRPLAAATLILAIWRSWYYLYTLSINGPAIWLNRLTSPILFTLQIETGGFLGSEYQSLGDVGANSFVLIFVLFVGLAPLYFSGLIGTGFDWRPEPATVGRRSVIRRIAASSWLGARLVYGALLLASVLFVARLTSVAREEFTEVPEWMAAIGELLPSWMNDSQLLAMLLIGLLCLFLFLFGIRAALFGLGLFAVATRLVMTTDFLSIRSLDSFPGLNLINQVPWLVVVLFVGLTACPLLLRLLSVLFPFARDRSGFRWLLTAGLILVSLLLSRLPSQVLLRAGGPLIAIGIGWVAVHGLANSRLMAPVMNRVRGSPWVVILVLGTIGLLIGWPLGELVETLRLRDLFYLMAELDDLFVYIVGFGLICLIWDHSLQHPDVIFEQSVLTAGLYLFAFLLINSSTTWLFIPVPFLVALLIARFWLFRPAAEMDGLREAVGKGFRNLKRLIQEALDASDARSRFRAARKALASQFEKATLTPAEYEEKLEAYEGYLQKKLKGEVTQVGITSRTAVFAIGEPSVRGNMMAALKVGSVLAFIPFCIALYRYFPTGRVDYPYPMADLLVFFVWAAASWLLYAIFFGYFLVHLRGNNGLAKGIRLFVALSIPFAIYRVLETQSLAHMRPFILWAAQLFLFCSLLGLLAVDYRLLRKSGFKFRDLRVVHNLPTLSAYASTVMAALIPGIVALFTGRLTDFVRFFLDTIIKVPSGGP